MIWLCCHTPDGLRVETELALTHWVRDGDEVILWPLEDDHEYGRTLELFWRSGEDVAVIEQDIVIGPHVVEGFHACESPYCAFPYAWSTCIGPALGCTRFRAAFARRYPDAMRDARATPSAWGEPGHWKQLDVFLMRRILRDRHGEQPHVHLPPVAHLNPDRQLRTDAPREPVTTVEGF